jgi:hypothetical protein
MPEVFNTLPGIEIPVGSISRRLAQIWIDTAAAGGAAPSADEVKATQLNLVLHLGFATTPEDGCTQFQTALRFAHRHPCRVVVLCPLSDDIGVTELRAKIYAECFLGRSKGDTRCVEFVALSYPRSARRHLENQVSVCLSTDLPLYYWAHRFSMSARLADYQYLLQRSKRVIFDTAIVPPDALAHPWPRPEAVRDLAHARLLPVRQSMGQFLARVSPTTLATGLQAIVVRHAPAHLAEGNALMRWLAGRVAECGADPEVRQIRDVLSTGSDSSLEVVFRYPDTRRFRWAGDLQHGQGLFEASFGGLETALPSTVSLLSPEAALSEAMFF